MFTVFLALTTRLPADVIHVPGDVPTIQGAIDGAVDGDEIVVGPGTWFEAVDLLGKSIMLRSSDGPDETVLDGSRFSTSIIRAVSGEGPDTTIEGFTLRDGAGTSIGGTTWGGAILVMDAQLHIVDCHFIENSSDRGGAIACLNATVELEHTLIQNNTATRGAALFAEASQIAVHNGTVADNEASRTGGLRVIASDLVLEACSFSSNSSTDDSLPEGFAVYAKDATVSATDCDFQFNFADPFGEADGSVMGGAVAFLTSSTAIADCTFIGNSTALIGDVAGFGGALYLFGGEATVEQCIFASNTVETGDQPAGGAIASHWSDATIEDCLFVDNAVGNALGLAQAAHGGAVDIVGIGVVRNCHFLNNTSEAWGGAIAATQGVTVQDCLFQGNIADIRGGAAYASAWESPGPEFRQCTFSENAAPQGGAMSLIFDAQVFDCVFASNSAVAMNDTSANGGAIFAGAFADAVVIDGCTMYDNTSEGNAGAVYVSGGAVTPTLVSITNSLITGNAAALDGGGISAVGSGGAINDLVLSAVVVRDNVAGREAGGIFIGPEFAVAIEVSVMCGNEPGQIVGPWQDNGGNTVAERCVDPNPGDFNRDGTVDGADLAIRLGNWG